MGELDRSEILHLMANMAPPCISIYIPRAMNPTEWEQDQIRLANLLRQAEAELESASMRPAEARRLLRPLADLPADAAYWNERGESLAAFLSSTKFRRFHLPWECDELVVVGNRFHVTPLIPLLNPNDKFFVLALSQNMVRFFRGTSYGLQNVAVANLPTNMQDALNYASFDRGEQTHSAMHGGSGKQAAVFHGQGGEPDAHKDDLANYFRLIDAAIAPNLRNQKAPLVLAGVEYLLPIYRSVASYRFVHDQVVTGNCDQLTPRQLFQQAWPLLAQSLSQPRMDMMARYNELAGTGFATDNVQEILKGALQGRVEKLAINVHAHLWGRFEPDDASTEIHESHQVGDEDLANLAIIQTISHGGDVFATPQDEMPTPEPLAAIFRY